MSRNIFTSVNRGPCPDTGQQQQLQPSLSPVNIPVDEQKKKKTPNYEQEITEMCRRLRYYRDPRQMYHVIIDVGGTQEMVPLESSKFKKWLHNWMFNRFGKYLNDKTLQVIIGSLSIEAQNLAEDRPYMNRVARTDDALYIDRCTTPCSIIKMDLKTGDREYVSVSPFIPRHFPIQHALPEYQKSSGTAFEEFFELTGMTDKLDILLTLSFLVSRMFTENITPFLLVMGEAGSGKTTFAKMLKRILDPSFSVTLMPSKRDDMAQFFDHQFLPVLDNVSSITKDFSDALCGMGTGVIIQKRKPFTVEEDHVYEVKSSGIITCVKMKNMAVDLQSRVFFMKRPSLKGKYISESQMIKKFTMLHPYLLDEILDLFREVYLLVKDYEHRSDAGERIDDRSADFSIVGRAVGAIVFNNEYLFDEVIKRNEKYRENEILAGSDEASALLEYIADRPSFSSRMSDLIKAFDRFGCKAKDYSRNPATFSKNLNLARQLLLSKGVEFTESPSHGKTGVIYTFINHNFIEHESIPENIDDEPDYEFDPDNYPDIDLESDSETDLI